MTRYNTNLASEFYVLSVLHRLGANANLTLGNKKSVDIVVVKDIGDSVTVDVKGLAGKTGWPIDNVKSGKRSHYLVFVCYLGKIEDPDILPEVYVVPSIQIKRLTYHSPNSSRKLVTLSMLRKKAEKYRDAWHYII